MNIENNNLVSVIIPVYNAEKYIAETIESVLNQTYKEIEIILVDDCSRDKSKDIINDYSKKYRNIFSFFKEKNEGVATTRNKGLDLAKGRYVAFLDSDDVWHPKKIEKQLVILKNNSAALSYSALSIVDKDGNVLKHHLEIPITCNYKTILTQTVIATSTVIIDRLKVEDCYMPIRKTGEDYATWLKILRNGNVASGINEPLTRYRVLKKSLSSNKFSVLGEFWYAQVVQEKINPIIMVFNFLKFVIYAWRKKKNENR